MTTYWIALYMADRLRGAVFFALALLLGLVCACENKEEEGMG